MGLADEISRRLSALKNSATEFQQVVMAIEGNYAMKETEIKALEARIERLKVEAVDIQAKSNSILSDASLKSSQIVQEAKKIMEEAQIQKYQTEKDTAAFRAREAEITEMHKQAVEKQKNADSQWHILQEREKKIKEALKL